MPKCEAEHPEIPDLRCTVRAGTKHPDHMARRDPMDMDSVVAWPNPDCPRNHRTGRQTVKEIADQIPAEERALSRSVTRNSVTALGRAEPTLGTKRGNVLAYLRARIGEWVDGTEIETAEVGGAQGTRRIRELRDMGYRIETRFNPAIKTTWEYRLLPDSAPHNGRPVAPVGAR